jgi:hypothetical protein
METCTFVQYCIQMCGNYDSVLTHTNVHSGSEKTNSNSNVSCFIHFNQNDKSGKLYSTEVYTLSKYISFLVIMHIQLILMYIYSRWNYTVAKEITLSIVINYSPFILYSQYYKKFSNKNCRS